MKKIFQRLVFQNLENSLKSTSLQMKSKANDYPCIFLWLFPIFCLSCSVLCQGFWKLSLYPILIWWLKSTHLNFTSTPNNFCSTCLTFCSGYLFGCNYANVLQEPVDCQILPHIPDIKIWTLKSVFFHQKPTFWSSWY